MKFNKTIAISIIVAVSISSCKKEADNNQALENLNQIILTDFATNLAYASYANLAVQTSILHDKTQAFCGNPSQSGLQDCRDAWKISRSVWEQTEAYLFGPVATNNIDPRIDTWPINFNDLEVVMSSGNSLDENYINSLDDALKGFHPIEYLIFGINGNKLYSDFSPRELEYLLGLTQNLQTLTTNVATSWSPSISTSYFYEFSNAGNGSTYYTTQKAAYEEMINAMVGICEEVADGKIGEPFLLQNPALEESPFSRNSIIDFTNNIRGIQNVYLGKNSVDGKGLEDLVRQHNLSLDGNIKTKISNAISALNNITDPFGTAITTQPIQVQNAINAINELKTVLDGDLYNLIQLHI